MDPSSHAPSVKALTAAAKRAVKEAKAEGDALKKRGRFADAVEHYIRARNAISGDGVADAVREKLAPWLPVVCGLEAACHLRTGAWRACADAATRAIDAERVAAEKKKRGGRKKGSDGGGAQQRPETDAGSSSNSKSGGASPKILYIRAQALENMGDLESASRDGALAHATDPSGAFHDALLLSHRCDVRRLGTLRGPKPRPQDFEITTVLGEGNYTRVLLAQSVWTKECFAIKTVSLRQVEKTERRHKNVRNELVMEREVLIDMRPHANVVRLYHTFKDAQSLYFLFQHVAGSLGYSTSSNAGPKDERKDDRALTTSVFGAALHAQIVNALEHLHLHGVVHRDLKPENIMVRPDHRIFLIDFGTAKNLRDDTHNGPEFVGTPEYMSPEAINSETAGPEADLWALGCVLYQMLCGQNAFVGGSQ